MSQKSICFVVPDGTLHEFAEKFTQQGFLLFFNPEHGTYDGVSQKHHLVYLTESKNLDNLKHLDMTILLGLCRGMHSETKTGDIVLAKDVVKLLEDNQNLLTMCNINYLYGHLYARISNFLIDSKPYFVTDEHVINKVYTYLYNNKDTPCLTSNVMTSLVLSEKQWSYISDDKHIIQSTNGLLSLSKEKIDELYELECLGLFIDNETSPYSKQVNGRVVQYSDDKLSCEDIAKIGCYSLVATSDDVFDIMKKSRKDSFAYIGVVTNNNNDSDLKRFAIDVLSNIACRFVNTSTLF